MGTLKRNWRAPALILLLLAFPLAPQAQTVTAVPKLDLATFTGKWYEIARFPNKREKKCVSDVFNLIAQGEKPTRLQFVSSCKNKGGFAEIRGAIIKAANKSGDGKLKLVSLWPFSTPFWVLALGPDNAWSLIGSPNHKQLWILAKTPTLDPQVLAEIEAKAAAQGFSPAKLIMTQPVAPAAESKTTIQAPRT